MTNFVPYYGKLEVKPLSKEGVIQNGEDHFIERGEVVSVPPNYVEGFFKKGDIVYFDAWGCSKTAPDADGIEHYIVQQSAEIILGRDERIE